MFYEKEDFFEERQHSYLELELYKKIDSIEHFMQAVIEDLYSSKPLDKDKLEHCLEEICHELEIKYPMQEIKICRSKQENS